MQRTGETHVGPIHAFLPSSLQARHALGVGLTPGRALVAQGTDAAFHSEDPDLIATFIAATGLSTFASQPLLMLVQLKLLKCDWGMEHLGAMPDRLRAYARAGYDGVECANISMDPSEFSDLTQQLRLDYVAMMFCEDEEAFRKQLVAVKKTKPILVNCHPGKDYFDLERSVRFFNTVMEMASSIDAQVVFETHRRRCLYSAWQTERILRALPELRITADFSHFTLVAENDLQQPPYSDMMDMAIERADHIHARVGSFEAPQVPDPRTVSGLKWTRLFEQWWDRIIEARISDGRPFLTINPEFGPAPYQPVDPSTEAPLANLWDVCLWMTERFRSRWAGRGIGHGTVS